MAAFFREKPAQDWKMHCKAPDQAVLVQNTAKMLVNFKMNCKFVQGGQQKSQGRLKPMDSYKAVQGRFIPLESNKAICAG